MHPYQDYKDRLENEYNKTVKELIYDLYIVQDEGPSVTARDLGIPRKAVLYFIYEYDLRQLKHQNIKKKVAALSSKLHVVLQNQNLPQS